MPWQRLEHHPARRGRAGGAAAGAARARLYRFSCFSRAARDATGEYPGLRRA